MSEFSTVRAELRTSEEVCDVQLAQLSELVHDPPDTSTLEADIEAGFTARAELVRTLYRIAFEPSTSSHTSSSITGISTATMQHQVERHSQCLKDHKATARRLRSLVSQERSRRTLLASVRRDIQTHRAESSADTSAYYESELGRVDRSHSAADQMLANAYEARAELGHQNQMLADVQRRMLGVVARIPGVNSLIGKINTRQKRNSLVLAAVIVVCVLFVVFVR